jgi:NDP-sugar pyrophosphorylase family protein
MPVAGHPFAWHQLRLLADHGARRVVFCVGHLGEQVEQQIGHHLHGLDIAYSYDEPGLNGTLGAIRRAAALLEERFFVLYGDTYLRIDYEDVARRWEESSLPALMTVLHNNGRLEASNALFEAGRVLAYDKFAPSASMTFIDYGLGGLSKACLELVSEETSDLALLYQLLSQKGLLFGYEATERFYEIGSPGALEETDRFLRSISVPFE